MYVNTYRVLGLITQTGLLSKLQVICTAPGGYPPATSDAVQGMEAWL